MNKLDQLIAQSTDSIFQDVIQHKDKHRLQIIYTQINRDKNNAPHFTNYEYNVNNEVFFNPASTVKLPTSIFALEKLNRLAIPGVNKYTTVKIDSNYVWQTPFLIDSTAKSGLPSIAQFIRRAMLVSENEPYNRLYQFVGLQEINDKFKKYGFTDSQISRQFLGLTIQQNTITNSMRFYDEANNLLYEQKEGHLTDSLDFSQKILVGKAHISSGKLVNEPIDFTNTNRFSLTDLQGILQMLVFPTAERHYNLTQEDYQFLYQYLSQYPGETNYPKYDGTSYPENYVKFYFGKGYETMPKHIRVFNKVGWAYGFLIDVSYVVDFKNKIEYMLTSTVYANKNETLNDDTYEFETVGRPFLAELGRLVYTYELKRPRKHTPDLSRFVVEYESQQEDDRPPLKDVEN